MWLESEDGGDWYWSDNNRTNDDFTYEQAPVYFGDCIRLLMLELNSLAINFESENITNYIEYNCQGLGEDEEYNNE